MNRRGFLTLGASALAMPAIVRVENIMPIFVPKPAALSIITGLDLASGPDFTTIASWSARRGVDGWIIERVTGGKLDVLRNGVLEFTPDAIEL